MIRRYDRILSFNDTTPDKGLDVCHTPVNASLSAERHSDTGVDPRVGWLGDLGPSTPRSTAAGPTALEQGA